MRCRTLNRKNAGLRKAVLPCFCFGARGFHMFPYTVPLPGARRSVGTKQLNQESKKGGSEITTKKKNGRTTAATISYNFFLENRPASRATQWCNQFDNYPWPEFCGQLQWGARFVTARLAAALGVEYWFDWFPFVWESLLRIFCTHPARC